MYCRSQLRMSKDAFATLVSMLKRAQFLRDNPQSKVEEQIAKFHYIIGNNLRNRTIKFFYRRSGETISRHFHQVLKAIISLEDIFLRQPNGFNCPPKIRHNPKYWPYFKDCVGAIDGTHFRVRVPNKDAQRYQGRKCYPTQNALAACSFDLKFTYILLGWEGSASDSRILDNALTREMDKLIVSQGSETEPHYDVDTQADIALAYCILHNYLMGIDPNDSLIEEVDTELRRAQVQTNMARSSLAEEYREEELLRKRIATNMWKDYDINLQ
ncbi:unnamed protein product [Camellia sinensis]